jgi:hypothetical protein
MLLPEIFDLLIPALFLLAIVYGALEVSGVFKNKAVKAIIAIAIALFAITSSELVTFLNGVLPYAVMLFVAFFFIGFIFKFLKGGGGKDWTLIIIILILLLVLLARLPDIFPGWQLGFLSNENLMWAIGTIVVLAIFYIAYKMTKGSGAGQ